MAFPFLLWEEFSDPTGQDPSLQVLCSDAQQSAEPQRNSSQLDHEPEHRAVEQPCQGSCPGWGQIAVTAASSVSLQSPWPVLFPQWICFASLELLFLNEFQCLYLGFSPLSKILLPAHFTQSCPDFS